MKPVGLDCLFSGIEKSYKNVDRQTRWRSIYLLESMKKPIWIRLGSTSFLHVFNWNQ